MSKGKGFGGAKPPIVPKTPKVPQRYAKAGLHSPSHVKADGAANIMGRAKRASKEKPDG